MEPGMHFEMLKGESGWIYIHVEGPGHDRELWAEKRSLDEVNTEVKAVLGG